MVTLPIEQANIHGVNTDSKLSNEVELEQLKQILLFQLDLIQQQQDKLLKKEKQMLALKQERAELYAKLEHTVPTIKTRGVGRPRKIIALKTVGRRGRPRKIVEDPVKASLEPPTKLPKTTTPHRCYDLLLTDSDYYMLPSNYNVIEKTNQNSYDIEVPSWRLKPILSCYQMEKTENLDDSEFHRRHAKLEIEEKKRKKWDLQRLREQLLLKKQQKQLTRKTKPYTSLFPNLKKLDTIEVTEKVPVMVFGQPIPMFEPQEFSLPWPHRDHPLRKSRL